MTKSEREGGRGHEPKNASDVALNSKKGKEMDSLHRLPFSNNHIHLAKKLLFGSQEN